ncbi:MAG: hypothetical protein IJ816_04955 [Alloprevotella sp.]|nr:hypothetical protein [Alloprevotella sp.]
MKKIAFFLSVLCIGLSATAQTLPNNTQVPVQFTSELSSKDTSTFSSGIVVATDVKDNAGKILIKAGTPVVATLTSKKARGVGRPGMLEVEYVSTKAVDGTLIKLYGKTTQEGENRKGKVLGVGLGVGLTVLWPMLFYLCKKGGQAVIPAGMIVTGVFTLGDYNIYAQ